MLSGGLILHNAQNGCALFYQNTLKQSKVAVSRTFLYIALLVLMYSIFTKTPYYFVAPESFAQFCGSVTKNFE